MIKRKSLVEGTWFVVPLGKKRYCLGLIARVTPTGEVAFCFFFHPDNSGKPSMEHTADLRKTDAISYFRCSTLGLVLGEWTVLGRANEWDRLQWPMPQFYREDVLFKGKGWIVSYSDSDPVAPIAEVRTSANTGLTSDGTLGHEAAEYVLRKSLRA